MNSWSEYKLQKPKQYYVVLIILSIILYTSNVALILSFKIMNDKFSKSSYFIYLVTAILFTVIFALVALVKKIYHLINYYFKNKEYPVNGYVAHRYMCIIGFLDATKGILLFLSASNVSGIQQSIFTNISIPMTFVLSYLMQRYKFNLNHFLMDLYSSMLALIGVVMSLCPSIVTFDFGSANNFWSYVFIFGIMFASLMNILQEKYTKDIADIDYVYLNLNICGYQTFFCMVYVVANFVFPTNIHTLSNLVNSLKNGLYIIQQWPALLSVIVFVVAYVATYFSISIILTMTTSIYVSLINVFLTPSASIIFWIIGVDKLTIFAVASIPIISIAMAINIYSDYNRTKIVAYEEIID